MLNHRSEKDAVEVTKSVWFGYTFLVCLLKLHYLHVQLTCGQFEYPVMFIRKQKYHTKVSDFNVNLKVYLFPSYRYRTKH